MNFIEQVNSRVEECHLVSRRKIKDGWGWLPLIAAQQFQSHHRPLISKPGHT